MLSFFLYVQLFLFIQRDDSNSLSALEIPSRNRLDHFQNCCCAAAFALERAAPASRKTVSIATDEALVGGSVGPLEAHEDTRTASATPLAQLAAALPPRRRACHALCLQTQPPPRVSHEHAQTTRPMSRHISFGLVLRFQNYAVLVEFYQSQIFSLRRRRAAVIILIALAVANILYFVLQNDYYNCFFVFLFYGSLEPVRVKQTCINAVLFPHYLYLADIRFIHVSQS